MTRNRFILSALLILAYNVSIAQSKKPLAGKEPSWVTINSVDLTATRLDYEAEDGYVDILYDQQMFPGEQSLYCHKIVKILTEAGIQNRSEVSVNFDPSYQQLIFHSIIIRRGNKVINQLNLSKIKTIQQEKDLHRYMYDGSLSSVLFLEDVRKGDFIEYSYTLKGLNPIFNGKYAREFSLNFAVPIYNLFYKLIADKPGRFSLKNINTDIKPDIKSIGTQTIYEWKQNNIKAFHPQDGVPSWYDPYAAVQISEYSNWKEVNDWATGLFPFGIEISRPLQKKIEEIRSGNSNQEQQILSALRFVQDDIRYMGIEMGVNSHKPGSPNKIYDQRFGDCKDKSYLLCTILRQLGIDASPVLINTEYKKAIAEWLPSATAFDHTTVRVKYNDKYFWFDPTISFQRGSISDISYPDYQCGLVIDPLTTALTMINSKEPGMVKINEVFDIRDMSGDAKFTVTTINTGTFADDIRSDFNSTSNYELLKTYKEFYAGYYEHITPDSIAYNDDEKTGTFTTTEYYTIHDIWEKKDNGKEASFESFVINGIIKKPKDIKRSMPFEITYPAHYKENIEINVPDDEWEGKQSFEKIQTSSFAMTADFSYSKRKFLLRYDFENLKNIVLPSETKEFLDGLSKKEQTAYILSTTASGSSLSDVTPTASDKSPITKSTSTRTTSNNYNIISIFLILGFIGIFIWRFRRG